MSQDEQQEKRFRQKVYNVLKNPIVVFSSSFLFALLTILFPERLMQVIGIISVFLIFSVGSILVAIWNEKMSAKEIQRSYLELQRRVKTLKDECDILRNEKMVLEKEVPRAMEYNSVEKHIQLQGNEGNARFSLAYHGINISESSLRRVRHFVITEEKVEKEKLSNVKFNNEDIRPEIKYTQHIRDGKVSWRNDIYFETSEPVPHNGRLDTSYEAELEKEYADAFKGKEAPTSHEVSVKTDRFLVEVVAPVGFHFMNPKYDVRDMFSDIEIHHEKHRISNNCPPVPKQNREKIVWDIPNPRLSYRYILNFGLKKR